MDAAGAFASALAAADFVGPVAFASFVLGVDTATTAGIAGVFALATIGGAVVFAAGALGWELCVLVTRSISIALKGRSTVNRSIPFPSSVNNMVKPSPSKRSASVTTFTDLSQRISPSTLSNVASGALIMMAG